MSEHERDGEPETVSARCDHCGRLERLRDVAIDSANGACKVQTLCPRCTPSPTVRHYVRPRAPGWRP